MTLEGYFKLSSYALLVTSFGMLAATGELGVFSIAAASLILLGSAALDAGRMSRTRPRLAVFSHRLQQFWQARRAQWLASAALILLSLIDLYWFQAAPRLVSVHVLLMWSALRLLRFKLGKDWLWLYIASFSAVLLAASMTLDAVFFVLLLLYLLAALSTLVSFEIQRAQDEWQRQHAQGASLTQFWRPAGTQRLSLRAPHWRNVFVFACLALLLIALLAAPLFLAMPRVPRPFQGEGADGEAMSGFSESVRLGEIARIKLNRQRVMRVRVTWPLVGAPSQLYWRGVALDYYDGGTWLRTVNPPVPVRGNGGSFQLEQPMQPPFTEQQFFLEPLNTNVIFAAPRAAWISGPDSVKRDGSQSLFTDHHSFHRFRYQVFSNTTLPKADDLRADQAVSYSAEMRRRYLQLPPQLDANIAKLAQDVAGDAKTNYDMAARLVEHLQNAYAYSLDLHVVEEGDPLSDFLFNTRAGHCEYFASALTILLRARGIPARLVNGFQMGEYSERNDVYVVRQSDAHSWVEAYFPRHGWVTFDPTPAAGLNQYGEEFSGMFGWLQQMGETMQTFWQERVIEFDSYEQFSLLMNLQRRLARLRSGAENRWFEWQSRLSDWLTPQPSVTKPDDTSAPPAAEGTRWLSERWLFVMVAGLALALCLWQWRRVRSWRHRFARDASASAIAFYEEMLAQLALCGQRRQAHQTPREFARQVSLPAVNELTQLYQQARFSAAPLSAMQIDRIGALLHALRERKPSSHSL